jgi:hypothetical protein
MLNSTLLKLCHSVQIVPVDFFMHTDSTRIILGNANCYKAMTFRHFEHKYFPCCGHPIAQWLRHYSTNRKIPASIPDEVIFF